METAVEDDERVATLVLCTGGLKVPVFYTVRSVEGAPRGYLRVAYGQGNSVNRLLTSVGQQAQLQSSDGTSRPIRITSSDPADIRGYLCVFDFCPLPRR